MKISVRWAGTIAGILTGLFAGPVILRAVFVLLAAAPASEGGSEVVFQDRPRNCGAAALATASSLNDRRITLREAERLAGTGDDGTTLLGLRDAARSLGMGATGVRFPGRDAHSLLSLKPPAILRLRGPHFVLLESVDLSRSRVTVADPAFGRICRPADEFARAWTGEALLLDSPSGFGGVGTPSGRHG